MAHSALKLASDIAVLARTRAGNTVPSRELIPLVEAASVLLNRRYGIGNRHSLAAAQLLATALHTGDGGVSADRLLPIASRLRTAYGSIDPHGS